MATNNFFDKKQPWSKIKDRVIAGYLEPYCAKLLYTGKPLKIVDCFAGKGKFDDGQEGSPLMIARVIRKILKNETSYRNKNIEACFIEKKYHNDLKENLLYFNQCRVISGNFEDNIFQILERNKEKNTNLFLYIDPYGIKSLSFGIFKQLKNMNEVSTEILMNFNSFGFLREGFRLLKYTIPNELREVTFEKDEKNSIERMNLIANGDYWQKIIKKKNNNEINMYKAEELFVIQYISELKNIYNYVINIPIKEKTNNIPKYHLIYGTNHHDGIRLMIDNMNKAWNEALIPTDTFDLFEQPNYYATIEHNLDTKILEFTKSRIHLKELLLKLIDIFGISYKYSEYTDKLSKMSKIPESLFDTEEQKIKIIRDYKTDTGRIPTDWNWDNEIYIERI